MTINDHDDIINDYQRWLIATHELSTTDSQPGPQDLSAGCHGWLSSAGPILRALPRHLQLPRLPQVPQRHRAQHGQILQAVGGAWAEHLQVLPQPWPVTGPA